MGRGEKMPFGWNTEIGFVIVNIRKVFKILVLLRRSVRNINDFRSPYDYIFDNVVNNAREHEHRYRIMMHTIGNNNETFVFLSPPLLKYIMTVYIVA